jgi:hypothetical protein
MFFENDDDNLKSYILAEEQQVLLNDGKIKKAVDLKIGDIILGYPSNSTVQRIKTIKKQLVRIISNVAESFVVDLFSKILVFDHKNKQFSNLFIEYYNDITPELKSNLSLVKMRVDFQHKNLFLHPYFIGSWIGNLHRKNFFTIKIISSDNLILSRFLELLQHYNIKCIYTKNQIIIIKYESSFPISFDDGIPNVYKINSIENRKQLIGGIIESNSTIKSDKYYDVTFTNKKLAEDFKYILSSIGMFSIFRIISKNEFIVTALVNPKLIETSHKEIMLLSNEESLNSFKLANVVSNNAVKIFLNTHYSIFLSDFTLI